MPGIYGDLRNVARNVGLEIWTAGTLTTTSNADGPDLWTLGVGTGSTLSVQKDATHQDSGATCAAVTYTHVLASEIHQIAALIGEFKGQTVSFAIRAATATAGVAYPWLSSDGGTTKTYGQPHSGAGATTYETLKVEGFAVPTGASALWFGIEFRKTGLVYVDSASLVFGSAAETVFVPHVYRTPAWTVSQPTENRAVDGNGTATTLIIQNFATLLLDLRRAGIVQ